MEERGRSWEVQGRRVEVADLEWIAQYVAENPSARRKRIAITLCEHWEWKNGRGHLKEMAARSLLNKPADRGLVELPRLRKWVRRNASEGCGAADAPRPGAPIEGSLAGLQPLCVEIVEQGNDHQKRWAGYPRHYHYLGLHIDGENIGYPGRSSAGSMRTGKQSTATDFNGWKRSWIRSVLLARATAPQTGWRWAGHEVVRDRIGGTAF